MPKRAKQMSAPQVDSLRRDGRYAVGALRDCICTSGA
jgi:hypothetical protein